MTRDTLDRGGFVILKEEALPSLVAATNPFLSLPVGCCGITVSLYSGSFKLRTDGTAATANTGLFINGTVAQTFQIAYQNLAKASAIGDAVGWVAYLGRT